MANNREQIPPIAQVDGNTARANQRLWHKFRVALASQRHPYTNAVLDIICRVTNIAPPGKLGQYYLEFTPRGLAIMADEMRGSRRGIPSELRNDGLEGLEELDEPKPVEFTPEAYQHLLGIKEHVSQVGEDPDDEKLKELLGNPKLHCVHEWDATDTHCVKCNRPKPDSL